MKKIVTRSIVPNLLTLVNLFAGFSAIVYTSNGEIIKAAVFIVIAAVFDMLDGVMARLFRATSEFGSELDSLCDTVSFGVAPSYMLYKVQFSSNDEIGILLASLPALAGAVRLARFNIKLSSFEDKNYFHGLPIPSSAVTIVSFLVFFHIPGRIPESYAYYTTIGVIILTSLAMVTNIRFDNLPRPTKKSIKQRPVASIVFVAGSIIAIVTKGVFIFPFMIFYILSSAIREIIYWLRLTREPIDELDESEDTEPSAFDI